jgi:hypothetical protein
MVDAATRETSTTSVATTKAAASSSGAGTGGSTKRRRNATATRAAAAAAAAEAAVRENTEHLPNAHGDPNHEKRASSGSTGGKGGGDVGSGGAIGWRLSLKQWLMLGAVAAGTMAAYTVLNVFGRLAGK